MEYINKPICIISFDHCANPNIVTLTLPILAEAGIKATLYTQTSLIGLKRWNSTIDDIKILHDAGWAIGTHTLTHRPLATLSDSEIEKEILEPYEYLKANGIINGIDHMSYPQSSYNKNVINIVKKYYLSARAVSGKIGKLYPLGNELYYLDCISMKAGQNPSRATDCIDQAIQNNGVAHIMFETIFPSDPPKEGYHVDDFKIIVNYIKEKKDAGLIDCMTISEFYSFTTNTN